MTDAADPDPLLALYRAEVLAAVADLGDGLTADPPPLDRLERAAARAKGAALIVSRDDTAALARGLEQAFGAARAGGVLPRADVTTAVTLLAMLAEPDDPPPGQVELVLGKLTTAGPAGPSGADTRPASGAAVTPRMAPPADPTPLLELFREEVRSLCGTLSGGLVALEADAGDPRKVEPLMRAAHSLKGAARIVSADPAVELAHVMEDLLVRAQKGTTRLDAADIDRLLAAVDVLAELGDADVAEWSGRNGERIAAMANAITTRTAAPPVSGDASGVAGPVPAPARVPEPPPPPTPAAPEPADKDRVVRVSAQSLSRLLSLAGESLVEARWLQPFARSLVRLRKQQEHLADALDDPTAAPAERVADARDRLARCRQLLADRIEAFEAHARQSDDLNSRLYREVIASRMRPFADAAHGFARMVRDVARQLGKQVRFEVVGEATDVDRDILDKLEAPLGHILRNAVDHGLETPDERAAAGKPAAGSLRVQARHHAGQLHVRVTDDGRGIDLDRLRKKVVQRGHTTADLAARMSDEELLDFLFLPGFSTRDEVTDVSGRGVGLDVVQSVAQAVGGSVRMSSRFGAGTTFDLHLPITLSVLRAVLVTVAGDPFALPLNRTDRLLKRSATDVRLLEGKPHLEVDGRHVGLVPAHLVFDLPAGPPADELCVALIGDRTHQYGLIVGDFLGEQDLVVRPLDPRLGKVPNVSAAAVLEDGSPVLIVDVDDVARSVAALVHDGKLRHRRPATREAGRAKRVLVVDDSVIVREVEKQLLRTRGYEVDLAVDGVDGWTAARDGGYDLVVTDIDMPRMTGLELVKAIRGDPRVQSLPVVVVSYKDRDEDRAAGLEVGANYYLTKGSFHDGRFLRAVAELIGEPTDG